MGSVSFLIFSIFVQQFCLFYDENFILFLLLLAGDILSVVVFSLLVSFYQYTEDWDPLIDSLIFVPHLIEDPQL